MKDDRRVEVERKKRESVKGEEAAVKREQNEVENITETTTVTAKKHGESATKKVDNSEDKNQLCEWRITATNGETILLNFHEVVSNYYPSPP